MESGDPKSLLCDSCVHESVRPLLQIMSLLMMMMVNYQKVPQFFIMSLRKYYHFSERDILFLLKLFLLTKIHIWVRVRISVPF